MKILCVDDDAGLLYLVRAALEGFQYTVITSQDAEEALELLRSNAFDVMLLDQEMPKLSGLEMLKQVQQWDNIPPIIMVTGAGNEIVAVEAIRLGASDYIVKDVNLVYLKILPSVIQQVIKERALIAQQEAAERALQLEKDRTYLLSQFIRNASHEFRTPLAVIQTSTDLLRRTSTDTRQETYIDRIQQQSQRILKLVDSLVRLARLDNSHALDLQPTNLNDLLQSVLAQARQYASQKDVHIHLEMPPDPLTILAEANELYDALTELIDNAIHASKRGDTLNILLKCEDNHARVIIQDNGIGMNKEQLAHIFERFYRADEAHSTPGFGLGLPLAARIFDLHHGTISISSTEGVGTEVIATLPLVP